MSIHIGAKKGDIAETVLLPGDPLRAKFIAENLFQDGLCLPSASNLTEFDKTRIKDSLMQFFSL